MRHAIHPEADAEFAQAVRYYADIDPQLGGRFYDEIERVIAAVCGQPDRFSRFSPPAARWPASSLTRSFIWTSRTACGSWP
ncbi:MAG: hypothetical protein ACREE6_13170 [Limisphaerales bacterium]